jgi:hypothetical protein
MGSPKAIRFAFLPEKKLTNFFSYEDSIKHGRGPYCPWTSKWRRYPTGIILCLGVHPKYRSSNKWLPIRTGVSIHTVWWSEYLIILRWSIAMWVRLTGFCFISMTLVGKKKLFHSLLKLWDSLIVLTMLHQNMATKLLYHPSMWRKRGLN